MRHFCAAGKFRIGDLPALPGFVKDNGSSNLCYMGLLGLCNFDDHSCYNKLPKDGDVSSDFWDKFLPMATTALEAILKDGLPKLENDNRTGRQRGGGNNNNSHYGRPGQW